MTSYCFVPHLNWIYRILDLVVRGVQSRILLRLYSVLFLLVLTTIRSYNVHCEIFICNGACRADLF